MTNNWVCIIYEWLWADNFQIPPHRQAVAVVCNARQPLQKRIATIDSKLLSSVKRNIYESNNSICNNSAYADFFKLQKGIN